MRGRSGLVPGFVPAGLLDVVEAGMVALLAGIVDALLVGVDVPAGAVVLAVPLPLVVPEVPAGVLAGAGVGSEVNGVGSGGNGFVVTLATY